MTPQAELPDPVRRALARDDLLMLARDAEVAVGIMHEDNLAQMVKNDSDLFRMALEQHMAVAESAEEWSTRSQALFHAGTIVRFCTLAGMSGEDAAALFARYDPAVLYERAIGQLLHTVEGRKETRDLTLEVMTTYRRIRDLRLAGDRDAAIEMANLPESRFFGTGAEPYRADFQYELGAALLYKGQADQVAAALAESEKTYWNLTRAKDFVSRHRYDFIRGLAAWAADDDDPAEAASLFTKSREQLKRTAKGHPRYNVQHLSVTLTAAEHLALGELTPATVAKVVELAAEALEVAELIRSRWSVIARSRSPLSVTFRRIYGDIALLVARLPGPEAARLGLRIALSAKQTGFAGRMRTGRSFMTKRLQTLMNEILREEQLDIELMTVGKQTKGSQGLDTLKEELRRAVSPMLADTVLPAPADVDALVHTVDDRYALDFVSLPDSLSSGPNWFRSLIEPDGTIEFERFVPGVHFVDYFYGRNGETAWMNRLKRAIGRSGPNWHGLSQELMPKTLLRHLESHSRENPLELLISAHGALSMLPWPALVIEDGGSRLVERAIIAQIPALTCLSQSEVPVVAAPALVRLVSEQKGDVDVERERVAWGLHRQPDGRVLLSSCEFAADAIATELIGDLASTLRTQPTRWAFVHIAAHGDGAGLDQCLKLPELLPAGLALTLPWPESVLMASCHVGKLLNIEDEEPVSFVMALLTGGSRCVVAAIDKVSDRTSGEMAADLVEQVRGKPIRLDKALRQAQLKLVERPVVLWALFNSYVR